MLSCQCFWSPELWVAAIVNQLFAFTFMECYVLVVLGFLVHADLTGEQSLSRLQATPPLERSDPGGRSRGTPSAVLGGAGTSFVSSYLLKRAGSELASGRSFWHVRAKPSVLNSISSQR